MLYFLSLSFTAIMGPQSAFSTLIGNQIGNANVVQAKSYMITSLLFLLLVILAQQFLFTYFQISIICIFTKDPELIKTLKESYYLFLVCCIPDMIRGMFKGVLRGLGLQNRTVHYNLIFQGFGMSLWLILFGFYVPQTRGLTGVWIANIITGSCIAGSYIFTVFRWDWHDIVRESVQRITKESKKAGCLQFNQIVVEEEEESISQEAHSDNT